VPRRQAVMPAPPVGATRPNGNPQPNAPASLRPFVAGTRRITQPIYDVTTTMLTSTVDLPSLEIDPNGFLTGMWLLVEGTTAGNAATVVFKEDAPFNALDLINFQDTNSQPLVGPWTGYDQYIGSKYGGYHFQDDAKKSQVFLQTAGVGAGLGGSFRYILYVPAEVVRRTALGSLPNKSASSTFSLNLRVAASTTVYSTVPTALPTVRVRILEEGWQDPNEVDVRGLAVNPNPPGVQTTQYWNKQTYNMATGAFSIRLQGIDSYVRNIAFILRDSTGSRLTGEANWPDPFTFLYETAQVRNQGKFFWQHMMSQDFGYDAAAEAAGGRDNGVYTFPFNLDFGLKPGGESCLGYLPVSSATNMVISGSTAAGSGVNTLTVLVNKIVPANGNPLELTGGK
jgi:hypothetical protein